MVTRMNYFTSGVFVLICCYSEIVMGKDPDPKQDFCVADLQSKVLVNGFACKDPKAVSADDFFFAGLGKPGNTNTAVGSIVTPAFVEEVPGLNTLGVSMGRIDFAEGGLNAPHSHPRASEIFFLMEGNLLVGFIDTNNTFFFKTLVKGDVFVFPRALVHSQLNVGHGNAVALAAFDSQFPGILTIANSLFAANPPLPDSVLSKAFRISPKLAGYIQVQFKYDDILFEITP